MTNAGDSRMTMAVTYCNLGGRLIGEVRGVVMSSYLSENEGNVIGITDQNGTVTDTISYDSFGGITSRTGTSPTPFLYRGALGYYTDQPSGRIYVRARTYLPDKARWLTVDPMWPEQPAYEYVKNNPITESDPTGLRFDCDEKTCGHFLQEVTTEALKELRECLKKAGANKEEVQKCFKKFPGDYKKKVSDATLHFIACKYIGYKCGAGPCLDPCSCDYACQECCGETYEYGFLKCVRDSDDDVNLGKCLAKIQNEATKCLLGCPPLDPGPQTPGEIIRPHNPPM